MCGEQRGHAYPSGHASEATHAGHSHAISADANRRCLWIALGLLVTFMAGEVVAGLLSGSLALLADAGHLTSDAGAIGLALFAMRLAARPAWGAYTFGLKRAEILSAMANGAVLLGLAVFFLVESIRRLVTPPQVEGGVVLGVAIVGIAVNAVATSVLRKADRRSLNIEGGFQHVLTDLYAFVGTAVAGAVVLLTGWTRADALASLVVAGLMARAGVRLVRDSGRIVLQAAPAGLHPPEISRAMHAVPGVIQVRDLHVWEVTSGFPTLSAHVLVAADGDCHGVRDRLTRLLADRYRITHATLQMDHSSDTNPDCPTTSADCRC